MLATTSMPLKFWDSAFTTTTNHAGGTTSALTSTEQQGIIPLSQSLKLTLPRTPLFKEGIATDTTTTTTIEATAPTQNQNQPAPAMTSIPIFGIEIVLPTTATTSDSAPAQQPQNTHKMITRSKSGNIKPSTHLLVSEQDPDLKFHLPKTAALALKFPLETNHGP
ncbi:hypothetical protein PIB30_003945 [Stylosanthes scabra]|uniref:Uncharacterized protein n=1 Tax=Stylosanthes scabra TaxID=79078 RepID=A0ABU6V6K0_9FABA|nr:hypothetical protein [Stylosanthes scabra]